LGTFKRENDQFIKRN
jgi:hypothetical protein